MCVCVCVQVVHVSNSNIPDILVPAALKGTHARFGVRVRVGLVYTWARSRSAQAPGSGIRAGVVKVRGEVVCLSACMYVCLCICVSKRLLVKICFYGRVYHPTFARTPMLSITPHRLSQTNIYSNAHSNARCRRQGPPRVQDR